MTTRYIVPVTSSDTVGPGAPPPMPIRRLHGDGLEVRTGQRRNSRTASAACTIYKISSGTTTTSLGAYAVSTQPVGYTTNILITAAARWRRDSLYIITARTLLRARWRRMS